jgi:hypothetical protein
VGSPYARPRDQADPGDYGWVPLDKPSTGVAPGLVWLRNRRRVVVLWCHRLWTNVNSWGNNITIWSKDDQIDPKVIVLIFWSRVRFPVIAALPPRIKFDAVSVYGDIIPRSSKDCHFKERVRLVNFRLRGFKISNWEIYMVRKIERSIKLIILSEPLKKSNWSVSPQFCLFVFFSLLSSVSINSPNMFLSSKLKF